jgi:hypothetical protein
LTAPLGAELDRLAARPRRPEIVQRLPAATG